MNGRYLLMNYLDLLIANGKKGFGYPPYTHTVEKAEPVAR